MHGLGFFHLLLGNRFYAQNSKTRFSMFYTLIKHGLLMYQSAYMVLLSILDKKILHSGQWWPIRLELIPVSVA